MDNELAEKIARKNTVWIFCCGMFRSGSTLQYGLASALVEKLGAGVRSRLLSKNDFSTLENAYKNFEGYIVLKAHFITPAMATLLDAGNAVSIGIYRDIRDVAVSMMRMWGLSFEELIIQQKLEEAINGLDEWSQHSGHMVSRYEDLLENPNQEINRIASHLNLVCTEELALEIVDDHSIEKNKKRIEEIAKQKEKFGIEGAYWDPHFLLHSNHIFSGGSGAWKEELTKEQVKLLEEKFGTWLLGKGYSLSNNLQQTGEKSGPFISYAQNYEDVMLWRALKHIEKGFYVDVGAFDPICDSVTQAFYERGWQGINIEPARLYYERLCSARPHDINLPVAVANTEGNLTFYEIPETGLSTIDKEIAEDQRIAGWSVKERKISALTLNQIFDKHVNGPIHFLKIDVEGAEKQALEGLDLSRWRPWILVVEATKPGSSVQAFDTWDALILSVEYKMVYYDGLNRFYVANEHSAIADLIKTPPNIFDGFITIREKDAVDNLNNMQSEVDDVSVDREHIQKRYDDVWADRERIQKQYDDVWADRDALRIKFDIITVERENLEVALKAKEADREQTEKRFDEVWADREQTEKQLDEVRAEREQIRKHLDGVWAERDMMLRSRSWRITAPLRNTLRAIRFLINKLSHFKNRLFSLSASNIKKIVRIIIHKLFYFAIRILRFISPGIYSRFASSKRLRRIYLGQIYLRTADHKKTPPVVSALQIQNISQGGPDTFFQQNLQSAVQIWHVGERLDD